IREISARVPGTAARLRIVRDGRDQAITVKLAERTPRDSGDPRPDPPTQPSDRPKTDQDPLFGLNVRDLERADADRLELPRPLHGILITRVEPMSSSFDGGIERGTVLLEINRRRIDSVSEYRREARAARPGEILTFYIFSLELNERQLKTVRG